MTKLYEMYEDYVLLHDGHGSVVRIAENFENNDNIVTLKWNVTTGSKQADFDSEQEIVKSWETFEVTDTDGIQHTFRAYNLVRPKEF